MNINISSNKNLLVFGIVLLGAVFAFSYFASADVTGSLLPSSDGNYLQWTPKTGSTHYTMVDESSCNGTTDYNRTTTVGKRDSYGISLSSVPNGATITAIEITPCASRHQTGNGSATMNVFYRWNGADSSDAGNYSLTGTTPVNLTATTFSGLLLAKDSLSTLEVGAVLSAGNKGVRLSRIAVRVIYTPPPPPPPPNPTVTTNAATNITETSVTLNGSGNPNGASAIGWFRYGVTDPGICNDTFGSRSPLVGSLNLGSGSSPVDYWSNTGGLSASTTYYYCAIASSTSGTGFGNIVSFTTDAQPSPPATPSNLTAVASSSLAVLNWTDNSTNEDGFKVERGTDGQNFSQVASTTANVISYADGPLSSGTYYFRVRAFNGGGNSDYSNTASTTIP